MPTGNSCRSNDNDVTNVTPLDSQGDPVVVERRENRTKSFAQRLPRHVDDRLHVTKRDKPVAARPSTITVRRHLNNELV
jgi:hypothetical protein